MDADDLDEMLPGLIEAHAPDEADIDEDEVEPSVPALMDGTPPGVPATSRKIRKRGRRTRPRATVPTSPPSVRCPCTA